MIVPLPVAVVTLEGRPAMIWLMQAPLGEAEPSPPVVTPAATVAPFLQSFVSVSALPQKQLKTPSPVGGWSFAQAAASVAAVARGFGVPVEPGVPACGLPKMQFSVFKHG